MSTDFHLVLPYAVNKVLKIQVDSITLPLAFYVVDESNNSFVVNSATVRISIGNYTDATLAHELNTAFAALATGTTASIDPATSHLVIGSAFPFKLEFSAPIELGLGWIMGYRKGFYEALPSYMAEALPNLKWDYIYLALNDYTGNAVNENIGFLAESFLDSNIICKINTNLTNLVLPNYFNDATTRNYFGPVDIQRLSIQLLDEHGRVVNLRESDWSFTLIFTCMYQDLKKETI
jgi:hypothetical protein